MTRFFRFIPTVFFLLAAGHLSAATMIKKPNFTGFQAGILGGGSVGRTEVTEPNTPSPITVNGVLAPTGFAAGLHLGYGAVMGGGFFLGVDAGLLKDWATDNCVFTGVDNSVAPSAPFNVATKIKRNMPFYIAPKFGFQVDNALPYVRVGYGRSEYKISMSEPTFGSGTLKNKVSAFMFSAGIDFLITPCLVSGLNYDLNLRNKRKTLDYTLTPATGTPNTGQLRIKHNNHQVLLKIAYKGNM